MAEKCAKVCSLKLNFAEALYSYTEGLRESRLIEGNSAQRLKEVLAWEDEGVRDDGVHWCSERRVKKTLQISSKDNRKAQKLNIFYLFNLFYLLLPRCY